MFVRKTNARNEEDLSLKNLVAILTETSFAKQSKKASFPPPNFKKTDLITIIIIIKNSLNIVNTSKQTKSK